MSDTSIQTHHRVCHLCEAMCGLVIQTREDTVIDIRGDREDPLSRGHVCPKAVALKDIHEDPIGSVSRLKECELHQGSTGTKR